MNNNANAMFKNVSASIIATIIMMTFGESAVRSIWNYLSYSSLAFYRGITDTVYRDASTGNTYDILIFIFYATSLTLIFHMLTLHRRTISLIKKKTLINRDESIEEINENPSASVPKSIKEFFNKIEVDFLAQRLLILILTISSITILTSNYIKFDLISNFNQRLTTLCPHITQQQEKEIKAKWATMQGRNDYIIINEILENYAKQSSITLPLKKLE